MTDLGLIAAPLATFFCSSIAIGDMFFDLIASDSLLEVDQVKER
jgi:hypothetical protein